ncbi:MAG: hypothetical protein QM766_13075 [Burkholderiaceae bacterium]
MPVDSDTPRQVGALPDPAASRGDDGPARWLRALLAKASAPPLTLALAALDHVIRQQGWARQRLRPFAGRTVRLALDGDTLPARVLPPIVARIDEDGYLRRPATPGASGPDSVTLWLRPSLDLVEAIAAADRSDRVGAHLRIEGDVALATALSDLARHLRWDVEDDLSHLVGDVAARRIGLGAQELRRKAEHLARRAGDSTLQFVTVEQPLLVPAALARDRAAELQALAQRIRELKVRVDRLSDAGR